MDKVTLTIVIFRKEGVYQSPVLFLTIIWLDNWQKQKWKILKPKTFLDKNYKVIAAIKLTFIYYKNSLVSRTKFARGRVQTISLQTPRFSELSSILYVLLVGQQDARRKYSYKQTQHFNLYTYKRLSFGVRMTFVSKIQTVRLMSAKSWNHCFYIKSCVCGE